MIAMSGRSLDCLPNDHQICIASLSEGFNGYCKVTEFPIAGTVTVTYSPERWIPDPQSLQQLIREITQEPASVEKIAGEISLTVTAALRCPVRVDVEVGVGGCHGSTWVCAGRSDLPSPFRRRT